MWRMNPSVRENQLIYAILRDELALSRRAPLHLAANKVLFPAGQRSEHVFCIAEGGIHVELYPQSQEGARVIPMGFHPGMVTLVHTVYDNTPDPGTLVASVDSTLYAVSHQEFRAVMHASVARLEVVTQFLAARLTEARRREKQWLERSAQERVALTLDYMASETPTNALRSETPRINATHELIADRSGISRAKVSRELKRLEQAGHVRLARSGVEILDRSALRSARGDDTSLAAGVRQPHALGEDGLKLGDR